MIRSCAENPRLFRMKLDIKHSKVLFDAVSLQNFQRNNQSILHKVIIHSGMENIEISYNKLE